MRLTFLGTGTSSGIPVIACDCAVCTSTDPRDNRLRTGAALQFTDPTGRERTILIDTTPDLRQQALRHNLRRCDAILFTHNHVDHTFGLDEVRRFNAVQHSPIDVLAEQHTLDHLRRIYAHIFERERNVNDSFVASLISHIITPGNPIELFGLRITPIRLLHGKLPIVGFRFDPVDVPRATSDESRATSILTGRSALSPSPSTRHSSLVARDSSLAGSPLDTDSLTPESLKPPHPHAPILPLAYCTDVSAIPPESWEHLQGLEVLVLDALRYRRHPTHFCFNQSIEVSQQVRASKTYFIHMTHDIAHADAENSLPPEIRLAYDGLVIGG